MRVGGRLAEQDDAEGRRPVRAEPAVRLGDEGRDLVRGDAGAQDAGGRRLDPQRDVEGGLQQRDLRVRLDHPAAGRERRGADELERVARAAQPVEDEERGRLVDRDDAAVVAHAAHDVDDQGGRVLVLLPGADVAPDPEHGAGLRLLEGGADVGEVAFGRDHRPVHALGAGQAKAGEVGEAGRRVEPQRLDPAVAHQRLEPIEPRRPLRVADECGGAAHGAQLRELLLSRAAAHADGHPPPRPPSWSRVGRNEPRRQPTARA